MDAASTHDSHWLQPGSGRCLAALLLAGLAFSWGWLHLGYRNANLERQGIDIVHHALIIYQLGEPDGINERALGMLADYPNTSHRLAALALPIVDNDPVLAMRFTAILCVSWLFALQVTFLCRVMPAAPALIVLLAWQWLCGWGKVANMNHFVDGLYNFSRAVGGLGLWWCLVFISAKTVTPWGRWACYVLAIAGAAFGLACHIVPGAVAFGCLVLFALSGWIRERQWERFFFLVLVLTAAAGMYWGTSVHTFMAKNSNIDGWMPIGPLGLLLIWAPIAGLAAFAMLRSSLSRSSEMTPASESLMAALLASGALQILVYVRMVLWGTSAPYAVKSLFYYTFPLAALLAIVWLLARLPSGWRTFLESLRRRKLPELVAMALLILGVVMLYRLDRGLRTFIRPSDESTATYVPRRDQLPEAVAVALRRIAPEHQGWYYLDPAQPHGSFYASIAGLHLDFDTAVFCRDKLAAHDYDTVRSHPGVRGILLPEQAPLDIPVGIPRKVGLFREYALR